LLGHIAIFAKIARGLPPNTHPQYFYTAISQKYNLPKLFYIDLWPVGPAQLVLVDPDVVAQANTFPKHALVEEFSRPILGKDSIAAVNGPKWKLIHSFFAPAFASTHVKNLVPVTADYTMLFHDRLSRLAETGETFSMEEVAAALLFDIIGKAVFNFPLNAQTSGSQCLMGIRDILRYMILERTWNPLRKLVMFVKKKAAVRRVDRYIEAQIIDRYNVLRNENLVPSKKNPLSILDLVLRQRLEEDINSASTVGVGLDRAFIELAITKYSVISHPSLKGMLAATNTLPQC
jgi:cytochrome P450